MLLLLCIVHSSVDRSTQLKSRIALSLSRHPPPQNLLLHASAAVSYYSSMASAAYITVNNYVVPMETTDGDEHKNPPQHVKTQKEDEAEPNIDVS